MDEKKKCCQWDVVVETCFGQETKFSITSTTNIRDLKLHCELEFAIPAELQVLVNETAELDDAITVSSLPSADTDNIKTLKLRVISGLQNFASSCMKGDIKSVTKGIQDNINQLSNKEKRAFVAAFIAAGTGKRKMLSSLLEYKEWFVDSWRTKMSQRSLLHAAVAGGDLSCVMNIMVVMTRDRLDLLHFEDAEHESPLDLARRLEKPALVELLEKYENISSEKKTVSAEVSPQEKTNLEVICLESTSLNKFGLTLVNKNAKQKEQKDQISAWTTGSSRSEIREKPAQSSSYQDDSSTRDLKPKKGSEKNDLGLNDKHDEALDQRTGMACSTKDVQVRGLSENETTENSSTHKTRKEKSNTSQQKTKTRFRKSSLKLRIPSRNKKKSVQEDVSSQQQQTTENVKSVEKVRANSIDKHTPKTASPSLGTVPKIKIIKNMESTHDDHVNSHAHISERARLSPTTENLITTQRPFSAHIHNAGSPSSTPRRLICERPRSSTIEKETCSSQSPPHASPPARFCIPHPPISPPSSRRRSWSPSPELVAKLSPILQRKFGSACDLERPRSGSLKLTYPSNSIANERKTPHSPTPATLPLVECKQFAGTRQDLPVQSMSAPTSPQSPRKLLPLKINKELEELNHRFFSTRARAKSFNHRRGSLPGNLGKDKEQKWREHLDARQKYGIPFEVWLKEKEEQTARKREFELAAMKAVEKLADQTWSEILSQGKTYEQWRKEKDQMRSHREYQSECVEHAGHGECYKRALKYEEWMKKKDEEDLRREEAMRQEAERHFEENRRKREMENERKIAKLTK